MGWESISPVFQTNWPWDWFRDVRTHGPFYESLTGISLSCFFFSFFLPLQVQVRILFNLVEIRSRYKEIYWFCLIETFCHVLDLKLWNFAAYLKFSLWLYSPPRRWKSPSSGPNEGALEKCIIKAQWSSRHSDLQHYESGWHEHHQMAVWPLCKQAHWWETTDNPQFPFPSVNNLH